jgi:hypothetical protein
MKNIHIIPTDKPSRLYKHNELGFKLLAPVEHEIGAYNGSNQNIYITNDEEIKEGDYVINNLDKLIGKSIRELNSAEIKDREYSKIILTTDQDLINDGVQAIDDKFLEWFVKNPSCERVEIKKGSYNLSPMEEMLEKEYVPKGTFDTYKIIIPQEEPKQETLEEAAEKHAKKQYGKWAKYDRKICKEDFTAGAKWQAENTCKHNYILTSENGHRVIKCLNCNHIQII